MPSFLKGGVMSNDNRGVALILAAMTIGLAVPAMAQDVFEEIVVRAQKRDQNIMEVPVAVSALSGQQLTDAGIKDVWELQQNVPGLIIGRSQTATSTNFSLRGIGSTSNNFGVESSVGLYVDDVYRSRQSSMINELVDVESAEVLRGPQGTLFGKNTPSGAILIRSVRPSHDPDAFIELTAGDFGLAKLSAAGNLSLADNVAARGTLFLSERDGYVDDLARGSDRYNNRDRFGMRLQLAINEPADDFNARIILDYAEIDELCCGTLTNVDGLFSRASLAGVPQQGSDAAIVALGGTVFTDFAYPQPVLDSLALLPGNVVTGVGLDDQLTAYTQDPISQNEDAGLSVELNRTLSNGITLTSITAFRSFDTFDDADIDFIDIDLLQRVNDAELDSFSQEFRVAGEFGDGNNYVFGLYYFGQELTNITDTNGGALLGPYLLLVQPELQQAVDGLNQVSALTGGAIPPAADPFPAGLFANDVVTQDQDGWAAFGQVDFSLSDQFLLTLGARFTDEEKSIDAIYTQTASGPPPSIEAIQTALGAAALGQPFDPADLLPIAEPNTGWGSYLFQPLAPRPNLSTSISDDQVTGTAKLTYFANDNAMFYASYATGFKSGGTNADRINPLFSSVFDAETSESFEVGFKGDLGPVRLALTYFITDYEDFQANSFTGTGFNVQNAGEISTDGIELEAVWRPIDNFEAQLIYTHYEAEYDQFAEGTCWDTFTFHTGQLDQGAVDADQEICDKSGQTVPYSPEDRLFLGLQHNFELSSNLSLYARAEYSYASETLTDGDNDPFTEQESIGLLNLKLGLDISNWNSTLSLWGRNVTDEAYIHGSFDGPAQLGRLNSYPSEPATYGLTFRKNFD